MNGFFKKSSCLLLAGMLTVACASCKKPKKVTTTTPPPVVVTPPNYTLDEYTSSTVYIDGKEKILEQFVETTPHEDGCVTYDIYSNIGDKNYLTFDIETDVDLVGFINYYNVEDPTHAFWQEPGPK